MKHDTIDIEQAEVFTAMLDLDGAIRLNRDVFGCDDSYGAKVVGNADGSGSFKVAQLDDQFENRPTDNRIQARGRLVIKDNLGEFRPMRELFRRAASSP